MPAKSARLKQALRKLEVPHEPGAEWETTPWINRDIIPLPPSRRTWGPWSFVGFWLTTGVNITQWTTGSSLISLGLNVWQAMLAVIIGQIIVACAVVGTGLPGGQWHVGFPIVNRFVWGIRGSFFPLLNRIVLSFTWYSTQLWFGGQSVKVVIGAIWPSFYNLTKPLAGGTMNVSDFVGFVIFAIISLPLIWVPPERYHKPFLVASISITITAFSIFIWALAKAGGGGALLSNVTSASGVQQATGSHLGWMLVYGITSNIGSICAGIFSQSDYSRFAVKPFDQVWSQLFAIPLSAILTSLIGVVTTSCAAQFFPDEGLLWQPYDLLATVQKHGGPGARAAVFFAGLSFVVSQFGINVAGNAIGGGIDLSGLLPKYINIRRGAYLVAAVAVLIQPWQLLNGATVYLSVMSSYAVFLGPLTGLIISDYHVVRKQKVRLTHLYDPTPSSIYFFWHGLNWRAAISWVFGVWPLMPGFVATVRKQEFASGWMHLYYLAWPLGFLISFTTHTLLSRVFPPRGLGEVDDYDYYGTFGPAEKGPGGSVVDKVAQLRKTGDVESDGDEERREKKEDVDVLGVDVQPVL